MSLTNRKRISNHIAIPKTVDASRSTSSSSAGTIENTNDTVSRPEKVFEPYRFSTQDLESAAQDLAKFLKSAAAKTINGQMMARYQSVKTFLNLQLKSRADENGQNKKSIAESAAAAAGKERSFARRITEWERRWVSERLMPEGKQGCGASVKSLLDDESMLVFVREWINQHKDGMSTSDDLRLGSTLTLAT